MTHTYPLQKIDRRTPPAPAGRVDSTRTSTSNLIVAETIDMETPDLSEAAYLPDGLSWQVFTPAQAARVIAKANTHLGTAMIVVRSWTQKGTGGRRGWGYRHTSFVLEGGKANLLKASRMMGEIGHNGGCEACGRVFADYVLTWGHAPDGWLKACPDCVEAGHLHTESLTSPFLFAGMNPRPVASKMVRQAAYDYRIFIDLTANGEIEVCPWCDYEAIRARTDIAVGALTSWVRAHSDLPSFDMFVLLEENVHSSLNNTAAVMRKDMNLLEFLVANLHEQDGFYELRAFARKARGL